MSQMPGNAVSLSPIVAYTDGACLKNPDGPGGWGVVVENLGGYRFELAGSDSSTTNNRMEMTGALMAMRFIETLLEDHPDEAGRPIVIHTDSEYVQKGMTEWMSGWKRRGWRSASGSEVKNQDLWQLLDHAAQELPVQWKWVRGHAGNPLNEAADRLASTAARTQQPFSREIPAEDFELEQEISPKRAGPIELDLSLTDSELAQQVRAAVQNARGRIVRFREAESPSVSHAARPTMAGG